MREGLWGMMGAGRRSLYLYPVCSEKSAFTSLSDGDAIINSRVGIPQDTGSGAKTEDPKRYGSAVPSNGSIQPQVAWWRTGELENPAQMRARDRET